MHIFLARYHTICTYDLLIWYHTCPYLQMYLWIGAPPNDIKIGHHAPRTTQHSRSPRTTHPSPLLLNYNHGGWRRWLNANLWRLGVSLDQRAKACSMLGGEWTDRVIFICKVEAKIARRVDRNTKTKNPSLLSPTLGATTRWWFRFQPALNGVPSGTRQYEWSGWFRM